MLPAKHDRCRDNRPHTGNDMVDRDVQRACPLQVVGSPREGSQTAATSCPPDVGRRQSD